MWARLMLLLAALLGGAPAGAQPAPPPDMNPAETWVWQRLRGPLERPDFAVNLEDNCGGTALDPREDDPRWHDSCRVVRAAFLERILTRDPWRGQLPPRGMRLQGMLVEGVLDLSGLSIGAEVWLDSSRFPEPVVLTAARFEKSLTFDNSALLGGFAGDQLQVGNNLQISGDARVGCLTDTPEEPCGPMVLQAATIGGDLRLEHATIVTVFKADDLSVGGSFHLSGTRVERGMQAGNLKVNRTLHIDDGATFGCIPDAEVCDALVLRNAEINGQLTLSGAVLRGNLQGNSLKVRNHLHLRGATVTAPEVAPDAVRQPARVNLGKARIDGDIDLSGATLQQVSLVGAAIGGDLQLSVRDLAPRWSPGASLNLRNASASAVQGSLDPAHYAWPDEIDLQGFTYRRLGGSGTGRADQARFDSIEDLTRWLARDASFSRQPYTQLASVFTESGDPIRANEILFASRYREEQVLWAAWQETGDRGTLAQAVQLAGMRLVVGYGLGNRFLRALWWVLGFSVLGMLVLRTTAGGRQHSLFWCLGASLNQLLPFVTLLPEFAKVFEDPEFRLNGWHKTFFVGLSVVGYVIGGFVGAGIGALTQAT
jgi:hypothetical protein